MIEKYINEIIIRERFDDERCEDVLDITILGDGEGDFEKIEHDCTVDVLRGYMAHCKRQMRIAKQLLCEKETGEGHKLSSWIWCVGGKEVLSKSDIH